MAELKILYFRPDDGFITYCFLDEILSSLMPGKGEANLLYLGDEDAQLLTADIRRAVSDGPYNPHTRSRC